MLIIRHIILLKPAIVKILIYSIAVFFTYWENAWLRFSDSYSMQFLTRNKIFIDTSTFVELSATMSRGQLGAGCDHEFILITNGRRDVAREIIAGFTLNVWLSPRCARTRDACDHDESGTVIVFCYGGTRGFDKYTRYIVRERVRALRAVRTRTGLLN